MYRVITFLLLFISWFVFSGLRDPFHLSLGVISSVIVTWMSSDFLFEQRDQSIGTRLIQAVRLPIYMLWLLGQVVVANWIVIKLALFPGGLKRVKPLIVPMKTSLTSDFARFLLAQSITLTPGTVTMKIEGDTLHIHAINPAAAKDVGQDMERRIARIFEPPATGGAT